MPLGPLEVKRNTEAPVVMQHRAAGSELFRLNHYTSFLLVRAWYVTTAIRYMLGLD